MRCFCNTHIVLWLKTTYMTTITTDLTSITVQILNGALSGGSSKLGGYLVQYAIGDQGDTQLLSEIKDQLSELEETQKQMLDAIDAVVPAIHSLVDQKFLTQSGEDIKSYMEQSIPNYFANPISSAYDTLIADLQTNLPKFVQHLLDNWQSVLEEQAETYLSSNVSVFEFYIGMTSLVNRIYKYFLYAGYAADFAQKVVSETKAKLQQGLESFTNWYQGNIECNEYSIGFVGTVYQLEESEEYNSDYYPSYTPGGGGQLAFVQAWWFTKGYDVTINHRPLLVIGGQYSANNWSPIELAAFVIKKNKGWSISNAQVELYSGIYDIETKSISSGAPYPIGLTDDNYVLSESTDNSWTFTCAQGDDQYACKTYGCFHLKNQVQNKYVKMPPQKTFSDPSTTVSPGHTTPAGYKANAIKQVHSLSATLTSSTSGLQPMFWIN